MIFIDLKKAYNSVAKNQMWRILEEYNINNHLIKNIKKLYADVTAERNWNKETDYLSSCALRNAYDRRRSERFKNVIGKRASAQQTILEKIEIKDLKWFGHGLMSLYNGTEKTLPESV